MDEGEFRKRMDRHLTRGDELLREIKEEVALTRDEVALTREEVKLSREQRVRSDAMMDRLEARLDRDAEEHADLRVFIREMIVRMERSGQELAREVGARIAQMAAESREAQAESRAWRERHSEEMRVLKEGSRAHTQSLLRLLDRFDGPAPGGATGAA